MAGTIDDAVADSHAGLVRQVARFVKVKERGRSDERLPVRSWRVVDSVLEAEVEDEVCQCQNEVLQTEELEQEKVASCPAALEDEVTAWVEVIIETVTAALVRVHPKQPVVGHLQHLVDRVRLLQVAVPQDVKVQGSE